jgi:hypothetical protein
MIEFLIMTLTTEWLRKKLNWSSKSRNNLKNIRKFKQKMPVFETVGELKELLSNFSDDIPIEGSTFKYPMLQLREIDGKAYIHLASTSNR